MKFKINLKTLSEIYNINEINLPKYVPQILNLSNQNAQATRPKNVGQLSELFPQFKKESEDISVESWREWYINNMPDAIDNAAEKIWIQVENLKKAINEIDKEMIRDWVEDLIINKTYTGLNFQEAIIKTIAEKQNKKWRLSNPDEESKGIDGYIDDTPVSIKPSSYKTKSMLMEKIDVKIIYYEKAKDGFIVEFE
ncbi:MjaI restriction endonuclease [Caloramator quimbayensis]|uniref:MjaI restriction endonuclease n=1 Tax=Caloramator quimbayensis TaxID=1147123 RepID=A0A1T4Y5F8_9CLOT|nr:MjaI family restriction endonuclease [Caloramator quimbayensis]SKA96873.1 MjaI restriction endonuclease [Caloramator quimbayensis]